MGLLDKAKPKPKVEDVNLSKEEITFILAKLRLADYKGNEFEKFYNVYTKLQDRLDNLQQ